MNFDEFMALSPQERNAYIIQGNAAQYGYTPAYGYAANLRNISDGNKPLTADQYMQILASSGIDPSLSSEIGSNLGVILNDQARASDDSGFWKRGLLAGAAVLGGGAALGGALGAGSV